MINFSYFYKNNKPKSRKATFNILQINYLSNHIFECFN